MASTEAPATPEFDQAVTDLSGILLSSLQALADAGHAEQA